MGFGVQSFRNGFSKRKWKIQKILEELEKYQFAFDNLFKFSVTIS